MKREEFSLNEEVRFLVLNIRISGYCNPLNWYQICKINSYFNKVKYFYKNMNHLKLTSIF